MKKTYTAKATALKDLNGKLVNTLKQADNFGECLEQKHWGSQRQAYTGSHTQIHANSPVEMGATSIAELKTIIKNMKNNKAPGPDGLPSETYKWLSEENLQTLINLFNNILQTGQIPQEWNMATVVEIYKGKGNRTDPEMYRPISLLSTAYKLSAGIMQTRLEAALDDKLRSTQHGFLKNKSTSQPTHIVCRLQERSERRG